MKIPPIRSIVPMFLAVTVLAGRLGAEPITLQSLAKTAEQLASPLSGERKAAERWLENNSAAAFEELARQIKEGEAPHQTLAARTAAVFLSPWARGVRQGTIHKGQIELFQPRRPCGRPVDHPFAGIIRSAALEAITRTVGRPHRGSSDDSEPPGEVPSFPGWEEIDLVRALGECLAEVADAHAADKVAAILADEPNRFRAGYLMTVLDTYHGLPRSYTFGGICGNSSPEEFREFDRQETARCNDAKAKLLAWHKEHSRKPLSKRIEAALDVWDKQLAQEQYAYYNDSGEWATQTYYAPLIRLGEPAVEALRRRAANVPDEKYWHRGAYEIAASAITGEVDKAFVEKLFTGETFEQMLACEIIAAAGSRDFKDQLAAMVESNGPYKKASYALAVVYRTEAIPILKKAHHDDFVASCAIAELRAWGE